MPHARPDMPDCRFTTGNQRFAMRFFTHFYTFEDGWPRHADAPHDLGDAFASR
jgi:hypothetical protein